LAYPSIARGDVDQSVELTHVVCDKILMIECLSGMSPMFVSLMRDSDEEDAMLVLRRKGSKCRKRRR
jgi:hypothetical protein